MTSTLALSAPHPRAAFEKITIERRVLRADDVLIDVKYAGICHSDIHQVNEDWGPGNFPMVPGHEIAGIVAAVGPDVTKFRVGDRVGVGCYVDSCGHCESCLRGDEQLCLNTPVATYNGREYDGTLTYGGYSRSIVVKDHFVVSIPDTMDLAATAPLLCAGITVYAPLVRFGAAGKNIAIIGMGGLGHVAVKIAHAMGAIVTVLSQSLSKKDDGLAFGADHYYATSDPETFTALAGSFDFILNTVSADIPLNDYLSMIKTNGSFVNIGFPSEPYSLHASAFVLQQRAIVGSNVGGLAETQRMLDFCAEHGIVAEIELIGIDQIEDAYQRVATSRVRYRSVIDIAGTLVA
ncbi:NAD(P)-dependent alcohol dehydrogenase [Compostimonas suwonensis]|uniref:alcohol dehydrogenase (NADP(+)) n=1 Tax=Compostimonas suwonensis TaxID=1048394 RepID=A0A2M9BZ02_9MICO|nr:NAD(P)-dependent alcohol dehydrogenase [Compostimonas suwonensis]PJJ63296.1 putative zinc-type alcohol dehydrogenase-like protein [Compostimonas suwonensis]